MMVLVLRFERVGFVGKNSKLEEGLPIHPGWGVGSSDEGVFRWGLFRGIKNAYK